MLLHPQHYNKPFPFFNVTSAFSVEECSLFEELFERTDNWQHRDTAFYQCSLADITEHISAEFQSELITRMREITGLPLVDRLVVTAQRMLPGQAIGIHSDRPLLGYEIARVVLQLNKKWQAEHGGVLELFTSPEGKVAYNVNPNYNDAFGFVLHEDSFHAVTKVSQPRQSMVFNFWHAANTPELTEHIQTLFTDIHFSDFPETLNAVASDAESNFPEETTLLAGTAAIALQRWGYDEATIVTGYKHSVGLPIYNDINTETYAAVRLAEWVAFLHRVSFDLARWETLRGELEGIERFKRLEPTWRHCLPR